MHQYNTFTSFGPAQYGFAAMIRDEPEHHLELGAFYQTKRDRFREQLASTRLKALPVPGGYFQLVDYSAISDLPDHEFVKWLTIEKGVTAIPLSPFYETPPAGQRLACAPRTKRPWTRRSNACACCERRRGHAGSAYFPRPGRHPLARPGRQPRLRRVLRWPAPPTW